MDRVKFDPLERADLEDVKALTDLGYEYDQRALGALLGAADLSTYDGGLLSGPLLTYAHSTGLLTLSSFSFLEITAGGAPLDSNGNSLSPEARVIRYDSGASSHINSPVDISAARTVGTTYTLYARSIQVASDTSARRRWDVSSSQEVSYSPTTRYRERVEFAAGVTKPAETTSADIGQWAPLFTYEVDGAGVLTHTPISALDASDARSLAILEPTFSADTRERLNSEIFLTPSSTGTESRALGLNGLLSVLKFSAWRAGQQGVHDELYTPTSGAKWYSTPDISLGEARQRIERLESRLAGLQDVFPFSVEIQIRYLSGTYSENVRISQSTAAAFTNELTVAFDNKWRTAGTTPAAWTTTITDGSLTAGDIIERVSHPVFIFDSTFTGGELFMIQALHTVHVLRDNTNTTTTHSSASTTGGLITAPVEVGLLEESQLSDGSSPAPRAGLITSRSYLDDSSTEITSTYAVKGVASLDLTQLNTDPTDNLGLTLTLNYQLLVRR
jgi:hypothetical protein